MKKNIHPQYYPEAKIICACGNIITTGSAKSEMRVEVCSACHPFYTGKKRLVDTTGRVDRFKKRLAKSEKILADKIAKTKAKKAAVAAEKVAKSATLETTSATKKKSVKKKAAKKK